MPIRGNLHVVEPGGQGGVYQHVLGNAQHGAYERFAHTTIHTARDAEDTPQIENVTYCFCMRYQRRGVRRIRSIVSLAWVLTRLLPHLTLTAARSREATWEVQGLFGSGIYFALVAIPKAFGSFVIFVPHNSFSRAGSNFERRMLGLAAHRADVTVSFVESEIKKFPTARESELRPLWMYVTAPSTERSAAWRSRVRVDGVPVIALIGQLRLDKNPILLLEAANRIARPLHLVFAGQDKGAAVPIREFALSGRHTLTIEPRYLEGEDFVALLLASDVLVCPYAVASQSGVIAIANQLGKPVVASDIGGLSEQTSFIFNASASDPAGQLAAAIEAALDEQRQQT